MLTMKTRKETIEIIERTVIEQLAEYREELTAGQVKLIAHQVALEATRRLADPIVVK